ncbi:HlyD family efflux transporter periplasmic adaptor subunit [Pseudomonas sp. LPB0260]|uniref:HlyD family secretion protein n=1 Tax=Pseudomonas sp. LPB0260 TaxID=2614442 RepID=UPI0015C21D6A|nr:HlyD family efflux transporter periplasmic adaptor subunit [Pseudomonas sp. LPB0260]QLC74236.1 HlyD family efflux transporter periplasmic adaptor subunit [Pseudomonas sp. LPB0260]QLC77006.1 HlyD family efflux transporter periplasmic adaptor subunit [Pseudomonas sp. LPB0260]
MPRLLPGLLLLTLLGSCERAGETVLLGTLEWDRIGLPAELSEPVLRWHVVEGERVAAGQLLLELDPRRQDARIAQARAEVAGAEARLRELSNGARLESIEAAQARLARNRAAQVDAERSFQRSATLHRRGLLADAELDRARASRDQARAASRAADAQLRELSNGTRPEQLEQAAARLQGTRASLELLRLEGQRLRLHAPRAGRVDALPFKPGDQPPRGAELVSLLVGEQPYARVYIPASQRAGIALGDSLQVRVEGVAQPFTAIVGSIRSEASFTPYFALSGDDASRLMYRAELRLQGEAARRLPAGLPLRAERQHHE